jgi:uncharacterized protein YrrD
MEINLQFKQNAGVFTATGEAVGHIDRVVVDPHTNVVTHIVVRKGFFFKEDKVVPIDLVAEATEDQIKLRENAGDLHALPPFEEKHYLTSDAKASETLVTPAPLGYSPLAAPLEEPPPGPRLIAQTEQNIPAGTIALKEGAKIITAEGKEVGHLERVFTDSTAHRATHLVIAQGLLAPKRRLIPITWANIVDEDEVHLAVKESTLDWLRTYPN